MSEVRGAGASPGKAGGAPLSEQQKPMGRMGDGEMRDTDRRQEFRADGPGRRLIDRIRALDPTILECGPQCAYHEMHSQADHAHNVTELVRIGV
jgi:hypothetical protein